jgi:hypothetical protein
MLQWSMPAPRAVGLLVAKLTTSRKTSGANTTLKPSGMKPTTWPAAGWNIN